MRISHGGKLVLILALAFAPPVVARTDSFESAVLSEINRLRADPGAYADYLREYRGRIRGKVVFDADDNVVEMSNEGVRAVDEAIAALDRSLPVGRLQSGNVLSAAAADHAAWQATSGEIGHQARGQGPGERVMARGGGRFVSEVISYGQKTPQDVVRQLVVDDGVPSRGHRHLLLSNEYRYAGVGCDSHPRWGAMCAIKLADQADGSPPPPPVRMAQKSR
jgi:Cysteine-rich secretory protein family